jgi:hypothetical protein
MHWANPASSVNGFAEFSAAVPSEAQSAFTEKGPDELQLIAAISGYGLKMIERGDG